MRVVSNTSPVSNLAIIGRIELLRERYGRVFIPPAVHEELNALRHDEARDRVASALREGWLVVEPLPVTAREIALPGQADPGETEAMQLALHLQAEKVLLDDALAREIASRASLSFSGLLGELLFAKRAGRISSVSEEIGRLRNEARFFISRGVEAIVVAAAGEQLAAG